MNFALMLILVEDQMVLFGSGTNETNPECYFNIFWGKLSTWAREYTANGKGDNWQHITNPTGRFGCVDPKLLVKYLRHVWTQTHHASNRDLQITLIPKPELRECEGDSHCFSPSFEGIPNRLFGRDEICPGRCVGLLKVEIKICWMILWSNQHHCISSIFVSPCWKSHMKKGWMVSGSACQRATKRSKAS